MVAERIRYITQAWLVIVLALCFGAALAGVQSALQPRIEQNRLNDTLGQIPHLVEGAREGRARDVDGQVLYEALDAEGRRIGWVRPASGGGFADRIELLIGLDLPGQTITGLHVLDQKETPGLGNRITEADWLEQFRNRPVRPRLEVVKGEPDRDHEIQAITGATISSESVVDTVNKAVREPLPHPDDEVSHEQ